MNYSVTAFPGAGPIEAAPRIVLARRADGALEAIADRPCQVLVVDATGQLAQPLPVRVGRALVTAVLSAAAVATDSAPPDPAAEAWRRIVAAYAAAGDRADAEARAAIAALPDRKDA